jgi:hypothetical protein
MFPIMPTELPPLMLLTINTAISHETSSKLFVGLDNAVMILSTTFDVSVQGAPARKAALFPMKANTITIHASLTGNYAITTSCVIGIQQVYLQYRRFTHNMCCNRILGTYEFSSNSDSRSRSPTVSVDCLYCCRRLAMAVKSRRLSIGDSTSSFRRLALTRSSLRYVLRGTIKLTVAVVLLLCLPLLCSRLGNARLDVHCLHRRRYSSNIVS